LKSPNLCLGFFIGLTPTLSKGEGVASLRLLNVKYSNMKKLRLLPLLLVLLYVVVDSLFELAFEVKLVYLILLILTSFGAMFYLYKKKQVPKKRLIIFLVFAGISIALTLGMYLYTIYNAIVD